MQNQHQKIKGYRELSQEEIDLMNRIKEKGSELLVLQAELVERLNKDYSVKISNARHSLSEAKNEDSHQNFYNGNSDECREYRRFDEAEPLRWASIGKTDIQTGVMALVRAVAQPIGI